MNRFSFTELKVDGFAVSNAYAGEHAQILVRASLTSDEPLFHGFMKGIENVIGHHADKLGVAINFNYVSGFLLIVHADETADFFCNDVGVVAEMISKRDVAKGEVIFKSDIADIRRLRVANVVFQPKDKIIFCFKVGWKFGLFFDLGRERELDIDRMELELGSLFRRLEYEEAYKATADETLMKKLATAGWFPFQEIVSDGFDGVLAAYRDDFDIDGREQMLLATFDDTRIARIAERWWRHPILSPRRTILEPALTAFKANDPVSCVKNLITEIEGIIRDAHLSELGTSAKIPSLLEYAIERGVKKSGSDATLFFPREFLLYLKNSTFAPFDPLNPSVSISRNSASHGAACSAAYTRIRALQSILTVDQLAFFL